MVYYELEKRFKRNLLNVWKGGIAIMKITIEAARVNAGFTQSEAAQLAKLNKKTLSAYEQGKRLPKVDVLNTLCQIYGCTMDDIKILP